jgi:5-formyltetrahydrofolate cyclo-ligase
VAARFFTSGQYFYLMSDASPKEILRTEALRHRARIDTRLENASAVTEKFFLSVIPPQDAIIAAYWPKSGEFDTRPLLDELLQKKFKCALPVMQKESRVLKFAAWDDRMPLKESAFGVMEPAINNLTKWVIPNIVIVPLLAFDRRGYRLGHGYGYYDATLNDLRNRECIIAVGVGYGQQAVLFNLPTEDHDQKLDLIITPSGVHDFRN